MVHDPTKKKLRFSKCFIAKNAIFILLCLSSAPGEFRYFLVSLSVEVELFIFPRAGVVLFMNIKESTIAEQSVDITYDYLSPSINNLGSILNQSHLTNL